MKKIITIVLILLSVNSSADVFIDKDIYDLLDNEVESLVIKELVIESIYDAAVDYATGDDGRECPSEILDFKLVSSSNEVVTFSYLAQQDYVGSYGCMDIPSHCELSISLF